MSFGKKASNLFDNLHTNAFSVGQMMNNTILENLCQCTSSLKATCNKKGKCKLTCECNLRISVFSEYRVLHSMCTRVVFLACFFREPLKRSVRIEGRVERIETDLSDQYFASRPLDSQVIKDIKHNSWIFVGFKLFFIKIKTPVLICKCQTVCLLN